MKKILSLACCAAVLMLAACAPADDNPTQTLYSAEPTQEQSQQPTQQVTPVPTEHIINTDVTYDYTFDKQYTPFWTSDVMYNECASFTEYPDGSIKAKLAFKAIKIISVRDWSLEKELKEGEDYIYNVETNELTIPEGKTMPYFSQNFMHGKNEDGTKIPGFVAYDKEPWSTLGYSSWGNTIYCLGPQLYEKQMFVTYVYNSEDAADAPVTTYQGDKLPRTIEKLKNKQDLLVLFYGDSIPYGCDNSKSYGRLPKQDGFPQIVRKGLQELYNTKVSYKNKSVGGTTTGWCAENVENDVIKYKPDLVFLLTGCNDGDAGLAGAKKNVRTCVDKIKKALPDCEIILMDSFEGNKDGAMDMPHLRPYLKEAFDEIAADYEGVVSLGIWDMHTYLLADKPYFDFSSNGINHPNDYMIRIYAQQLIAALYEF